MKNGVDGSVSKYYRMDLDRGSPKRVKPYRIHAEYSTKSYVCQLMKRRHSRAPFIFIVSCVTGYWHDSRWFLLWRQQRRVQEYHGQSALPWQVGQIQQLRSCLSDLGDRLVPTLDPDPDAVVTKKFEKLQLHYILFKTSKRNWQALGDAKFSTLMQFLHFFSLWVPIDSRSITLVPNPACKFIFCIYI